VKLEHLEIKWLAAALAGAVALSIASAAQQDEATAVANRIAANLMQAWNNHDGTTYAAEFWPDGEFVNIFGRVMQDQQGIALQTDAVVKGALRGRVSKMTIRKVRRLAPNVIMVDSDDTDAGSATQAVTRLKLILERRGDVWRAIAAQNTRVGDPPRGAGYLAARQDASSLDQQ
jgi:uncharacterized protein (TIGR02246 family)